MTLRCIKDVSNDRWHPYKIGDTFEYIPWENNYQGENERTRRKKGLFVFCDGMGSFRCYELGIDVEVAVGGER